MAAAAIGLASSVKPGSVGAAARNVLRRLHSSSGKNFETETAMFNHKMEMKNLLHEHNMKITKLQSEVDITKAELKTVEETLKLEVVKSQTRMLLNVMAAVGIGPVSSVVFSWPV